jgi:metallo-beta-lactamase family protein
MKKLHLTFYGGVGTVSGANFLLECGGLKILVDCGIYQGGYGSHKKNKGDFTYDPSTIDVLFVTHAHADHIGRIPKLARDGFRGKIYSTPATKEVTAIMFADALSIMRSEFESKGFEPLYDKNDVSLALSLWNDLPYHEHLKLNDDCGALFKNAGHILGSAMVELDCSGKKIVFTGDLGNSPAPLIQDTEKIEGADYMIIESVYGDRNHDTREQRNDYLKKTILENIRKNGTLIIPAFALDRTQVLLYEINNFVERGEIPEIPVFLDSPLAIQVTEVYKNYTEHFNEEVQKQMREGDNVLDFPKLKFTRSARESIGISETSGPKIIIAGSGMSDAGRVLGHHHRYLSDPKNTVLLVGYQSPGSIGRILQDGSKKVRIHNEDVSIKAEIKSVQGYSAHKDSDGLLMTVADSVDTLKKVFVSMGEPRSSLFLVQKIKDNLGVEAVYPKEGETFEL